MGPVIITKKQKNKVNNLDIIVECEELPKSDTFSRSEEKCLSTM